MRADLKGALKAINKSWKSFVHNGKPMTKDEVEKCLKYGIAKGYDHTGQLTDEDIDNAIKGKHP